MGEKKPAYNVTVSHHITIRTAGDGEGGNVRKCAMRQFEAKIYDGQGFNVLHLRGEKYLGHLGWRAVNLGSRSCPGAGQDGHVTAGSTRMVDRETKIVSAIKSMGEKMLLLKI
jgi:hypothetical protein